MGRLNSLPLKQSEVWNRTSYHALRGEVRSAVEGLCGKAGSEAALHYLSKKLLELRSTRTYHGQLARFVCTVEMIHVHRHLPSDSSTLKKVGYLKANALAILEDHQVKPRTSRVSEMYRDLYSALGAFHESRKDVWRAHWQELLADHCDPQGKAAPVLEAPASRALILRFLAGSPLSPPSSALAAELREMRFSGRALEARVAFEAAGAGADAPDRLSAIWEYACAGAQLNGNVEPILLMRDPENDLRRALHAQLWWRVGSAASPVPPALSSLKRQVSRHGTPEQKDTFSCVERLFRCTDTGIPILDRLEFGGDLVVDLLNLTDAESVLLLLAGTYKWLRSAKQTAPARSVGALYRDLCSAISANRTQDILGILELRSRDGGPRSSWTGRSGRVLALGTGLALALGRKRVRQLFSRGKRAKRINEEETKKIAALVAGHLGELKGPLMKLGQHLSYMGLEVPEESARALASLQDRSPAARWDAVQATVESELGGPIGEFFESFDPVPIGTGSIGQVHRARLKSGEAVAVKVQYPGIREAIESDLRTLRMLLPIGKFFSPNFYDTRLLDELREMLLGECDYVREARAQTFFSQRLAQHAVLRVPRVFPELSTGRVLTMQFVQGQTHREFSRTAPPEQLTRAGDALAYYFSRCFAEGYFNSDPHPGNFLFTGQLVYLLDFGSVKRWSPQATAHASKLLAFGLTGDPAQFKQMIDGMGLPVDRRHFKYPELREAFMEAELGTMRDAAPAVLSAAKIRAGVRKMFGLDSANIRNLRLPGEYLFGFRGCFSYLFMMAELGARIHVREAVQQAVRDSRGPASVIPSSRP